MEFPQACESDWEDVWQVKINQTNRQQCGDSGLYKSNMPNRTHCLLCIKFDYVWDLGGYSLLHSCMWWGWQGTGAVEVCLDPEPWVYVCFSVNVTRWELSERVHTRQWLKCATLQHLDAPRFSMYYLKDGVSFRKLHLFITHYLCDPSQNINITKTKQKFICSVFHVCCYLQKYCFHKPTLRQGTECGRHHRHDCCTHLSQSLKAKLAAPPQFLADSLNPLYSLWLQTLASGENSLRGK